MSERQAELQRQRALLQAQLSKLDQEIASPSGPAAAPPSNVPPHPLPAQPAAAAPIPDSLLDQYRDETTNTVQNVRHGCYVAFALALLLLAGTVLAIYYFRHAPPPAK